jgi:hypothetical protein
MTFEIAATETIVRITVDNGRYVFRREAILGFHTEGPDNEKRTKDSMIIYLNGQTIRFELPEDPGKQLILFTSMESILRGWKI